MANMLTNPTLSGFSLGRYFTDQSGNTGTIENPDHWEFVAYSREDDPEKLVQSLHRDRGFVMSAGYRKWEGGYVQRGITLQANQRYLAKAVYKPDVNFLPDHPVDLGTVTWQFRMMAGDTVLEEGWKQTGKGEYKHEEESLFVFEATSAVTIDYSFFARSIWASNACDFNVYELSLEAVPADYGGATVPTIGQAQTASQPSTPVVTTPTTTATPTATSLSDKKLSDVMSVAELEQVVAGLQSLAKTQTDPTITNGINTLATVLQRLKA